MGFHVSVLLIWRGEAYWRNWSRSGTDKCWHWSKTLNQDLVTVPSSFIMAMSFSKVSGCHSWWTFMEATWNVSGGRSVSPSLNWYQYQINYSTIDKFRGWNVWEYIKCFQKLLLVQNCVLPCGHWGRMIWTWQNKEAIKIRMFNKEAMKIWCSTKKLSSNKTAKQQRSYPCKDVQDHDFLLINAMSSSYDMGVWYQGRSTERFFAALVHLRKNI